MDTEATTGRRFHDYCTLFPLMSRQEHVDLVADIKKRGLLHPIITFHDEIIDGRNRFRACLDAGVEPRFTPLPEGLDPLGFVVSTNYARRHLSDSQRALAAARIEQHAIGRAEAGKMFKVRGSAVKQAELVLKYGVPELIEAVEQDRIPVAIAAKVCMMPDDAQREAAMMKPADLRGLVKAQARLRRNATLAKKVERAIGDLGEQQFSVVMADPPWSYEVWSENGKDRAAENHYPVMKTADICAMKVPAADDSVLFLWVTGAMMPQGLEVMKAWGFEYKSQFVWHKDRSGLGHWNRSRHELLLVGTRGSIPAPNPGSRRDSVIDSPVLEHSVKPEVVYSWIEEWYPNLPKIELFARRERAGWSAHGNELPEPAEQAAD